MKKIKFRGKTKATGKWVYGYYVKTTLGTNRHWIVETSKGQGGWFMPMLRFSVIPETVGQYTGLKGENDIEIYEGDIVKVGNIIGKIVYSFDAFVIENDCGQFELWFDVENTEILGNIYDNPELIS